MYSDSELLTAMDSGIQTVVPLAASAPQIVYLDFDGANASYCNRDLGIAIDNVAVDDSGFDSATISVIVDALNGQFGDDVVFTSELPSEGVFSTIYVGVTSAFDEYGSFYGLAETIDSGNHIHDDNAFVLLDSTATTQMVVSVIAHETEHIVHGMDHGGEGLDRFAVINVTGGVPTAGVVFGNEEMNVYNYGMAYYTTVNKNGMVYVYSNGKTYNTIVNYGGHINVYATGMAQDTTLDGGYMLISSGGIATITTVNSGGKMEVSTGGMATYTTVNDGYMLVREGGTANGTVMIGGRMYVNYGGTANITTVSGDIEMVVNGGTANNTTLSGGTMYVDNQGQANSTTLVLDCFMYVNNGGLATNTTVNGGGMYVFIGGLATNTTVNGGGMHVTANCTAKNTTVNNGGQMGISKGGAHGGSLQIADGGVVSAHSSAVIDFTVAEQEDRNNALVNRYDYIRGTPSFTITLRGDEEYGKYALAGYASAFHSTVTVKTTSGTLLGTLTVGGSFISDKTIYSLAIDNQTLFFDAYNTLLTNVKCETDGNSTVVDWSDDGTMECSRDYDARLSNGTGVLAVDGLAASGLELLNLPAGEMAVSVKPGKSDVWTALDALKIPDVSDGAAVMSCVVNGMAEAMFARGTSVWGGQYVARHVGGGWSGARPEVALAGRNVLEDIFIGSEDATLLLLTDDANGDAVFLEDVCSAFPDGVGVSARVAKIDEIRAGAGDDVVDLTSQRFSHVGDGMTVRGGLGDDVIWAAGNGGMLFGDAGDDWIVGSGGNDVIVGGIGDDRLHGGGGSDIFCFCADWGHDTVEQFASGSVTLWFEEGDESKWDNSSLTYADGDNSVTVTGVESVTLLFGNADRRHSSLLAAGAFDAFTSEKIFEERGMLA